MKEIHVLYGFSSEKIAKGIDESLRALGYKALTSMRPTKYMLKDYVENHPELDVVIMKEYLDGGSRYGIEELVDLADEVNTNYVIILSPMYRGKDAMKELYAAGILNVIFSDEKRGVKPDSIAKLVINGRTRKQAREYYRIDRKQIKKQLLTQDEYTEMYKYLGDKNKGINLIERFVTVSRWVNAEQLALFIKALPEEARKALKRYKEFYDIYNRLFRQGLVEERLKCPKEAVVGLPPEGYENRKARREESQEELPEPMYSRVIMEEQANGGGGEPMQTEFQSYIPEMRRRGVMSMGYGADPQMPPMGMTTGQPQASVPPVQPQVEQSAMAATQNMQVMQRQSTSPPAQPVYQQENSQGSPPDFVNMGADELLSYLA